MATRKTISKGETLQWSVQSNIVCCVDVNAARTAGAAGTSTDAGTGVGVGTAVPLRRSPALLLHAVRTGRAIPRPVWLALKTDAAPVEPLVWARVVVARYHVAKAHVLTQAVFLIVTCLVIVDIHGVVVVVILDVSACASRSTCWLALVTSFLVLASSLVRART